MKKLLLILLLAAAALPFQNCGPDDEPDPIITPKDTTKVKVEPINSFKFNNITLYNLKWDSTNMFGSYRTGTDQTTIVVEGYTSNNYAKFNLKFPGNKLGTYKFSKGDNVDLILTTGQGVKEKQYEFKDEVGRDMTVTVTKYDPVGGRIKGTFFANLQEAGSITTGDIYAGTFEVVRVQDEM